MNTDSTNTGTFKKRYNIMLNAVCRFHRIGINHPQRRCQQLLGNWTHVSSRSLSVTHHKMADKTAPLVDAAGRQFLQQTHDIMVEDSLVKGTDRSRKVADFKTPDELKATMDFSISDKGASREEMLELFKQTSELSVHTAHPHYFNQLYAGRNLEGMAAAWLTDALNTNVHTYESAPVFSMAELEVIKEACNVLGFTNGDGAFAAGGSMCNFMGIHLARFTHDRSVKQKGLVGQPRQILFASRDAHYSVSKAAHFLGFGTDSVVFVETDNLGKMIPEALEAAIKAEKAKGHTPLCTIATSGTTVLGSFDSLGELADVCHKYGCWIHVDACWGGGVAFSPNHRHLMAGVEKTDSVSISFHKLLGAQIQCAAIMVREKDMLVECNAIRASYLFQPDKDYYDPYYDIGSMTVQCGRKADGYKMWALWKSRGHRGMQEYVDQAFRSAEYFTEKLKSREGFKFVLPAFQHVNISFWYIPPSVRGQEETEEWWQTVAKAVAKIKSRMIHSGTLAIGYQPMESKGFVNFFRIILDNPLTTKADMDFVLDEIERLGKDL